MGNSMVRISRIRTLKNKTLTYPALGQSRNGFWGMLLKKINFDEEELHMMIGHKKRRG